MSPPCNHPLGAKIYKEDGTSLWTSALAMLGEDARECQAFENQDKLKVLDDILQLTNEARSSRNTRRWRVKHTTIGALLGKTIRWVDSFKPIGDTVVQYDPVHAALPWPGVRFLLQVRLSLSTRCLFANIG